MKFLFITLTCILSLFATNSYADDVKVAPVVLESFKTSFENATDVKWAFADNLYKANFEFNEQYVTAFYDLDGELVAVTKNMSSNQLPITLQTALKKDYQNYWVTDLFELSDEESTCYYITLEDADNKIVLKSTGTSGWTTYKKLRKS